MPSTPPLPDPRHRLARRVVVLLGPDGGDRPGLSDRVKYLTCDTVAVGVGGNALDAITLTYDLKELGLASPTLSTQRLQDIITPSGFDRTVEIRLEDEATGDLKTILGWGKLSEPNLGIAAEESAGIIANLGHHLFGEPLVGYPVKNATNNDALIVERDIVFNPEVDDKLCPNRSTLSETSTAGPPPYEGGHFFLEVESMRTAKARTLQAADAERWDLATAVVRLCWTLNPEQTWIKNPSLADVQAACGTETILLENLRIKLGTRLPAALDLLLDPYGFTWYVRHSIDDTDAALPVTSTITVIERGQGISVDLRLQRIGEWIDSTATNVESLKLNWKLADRPNVIRGFSAMTRREGTFRLFPRWPKTEDTLTRGQLDSSDERKEHPDTFRTFVFDSAGDYKETRIDFPNDFEDLEPLFGAPTVPTRRRFYPALTLGRDRKLIGRNGYYLEWNDGTDWKEYTSDFSILESEAGVKLSSPPEQFLTRFRSLPKTSSLAMLRLTACLEADTRATHTAERLPEAPNGAEIMRDYDLKEKFKDARVCDAGVFESIFYDDRHAPIVTCDGEVAAVVGPPAVPAVPPTIVITGEFDWLLPGDRVNVIDSTYSDGVYVVKSSSVDVVTGQTTIVVEGKIAESSTDGTLALLTTEEAPGRAMKVHCEAIRREETFAPLQSACELFGIDHPEFELGKIIPGVQSRNLQLVSLDPTAADQRHPQIVAMTFRLHGDQSIALRLEQYDGRLRYKV